MKKVIYVSYSRLTDKVSRDWYIDFLISRGVTVEYWDITSLVRKEFDEPRSKTADYLRIPRTLSEVEAMVTLPENRDAYYVMLVSYEGRFAWIYRMLTRYDCRMLYIDWGAMPANPVPKFRRIMSLLGRPIKFAGMLFDRVKAIAYRRLGLVKPFDIVFAAGRVCLSGGHYARKVVPINLCDYDHYVRVKSEKTRPVNDRYAVFHDINLAYHSDFALCDLPAVNPANYFSSLNRCFSLLESEYGIKVVIASHPKSDYGDETFQGREIYYNLTPELTRDADFVISHTSTALSYAVLNFKPIVFIYTSEMLALYQDTLLREEFCFANYLGAAIYDIDKIAQGDHIVFNAVSAERYEDYKYSFLTSQESENEMTQEIFWREITR